MSEEEEVLWETSARHLCFRCFLPILTHFIADLWGYSEQTFLSHTAGILLFKQDLVAHSCTVILTCSAFLSLHKQEEKTPQ